MILQKDFGTSIRLSGKVDITGIIHVNVRIMHKVTIISVVFTKIEVNQHRLYIYYLQNKLIIY